MGSEISSSEMVRDNPPIRLGEMARGRKNLPSPISLTASCVIRISLSYNVLLSYYFAIFLLRHTSKVLSRRWGMILCHRKQHMTFGYRDELATNLRSQLQWNCQTVQPGPCSIEKQLKTASDLSLTSSILNFVLHSPGFQWYLWRSSW